MATSEITKDKRTGKESPDLVFYTVEIYKAGTDVVKGNFDRSLTVCRDIYTGAVETWDDMTSYDFQPGNRWEREVRKVFPNDFT